MSATSSTAVLDGLFHGVALEAFLEQARIQGNWPDVNATRRLAYRLYEEALAERKGPKDEEREEFRTDSG